MSFIAWFYRQLKKFDQSLDEFYAEIEVIYNPNGTVTYSPQDDISIDRPEDEQNVLK